MAPISFHALSVRAPDGRVLLADAAASLGPGLTALVGANGAGKSTLLRVLAGDAPAAGGDLRRRGEVRRLAPQDLAGLGGALADWPRWLREAAPGDRRLSLRLMPAGIDPVFASPGERARAWLAWAVVAPADAWLLDEPSAHLDADGRAALMAWLGRLEVPALVASHDRALLARADAVWSLANARLRLHGGGYDAFVAESAGQAARARETLARERREQQALARRVQAARERSDQRSARGVAAVRDGSQGRLLAGYLKGRAEHGQGARARAAAAREQAAREAVAEARAQLVEIPDFRLDLGDAAVGEGRRLLLAEGLALHAGDRPLFEGLDLVIQGPRRLAITGPNGSGKSRLLRVLAGLDAPASGRVTPGALPVVLLDQSGGDLRDDERVLDAFLRHQPMPEGAARERLAWFLFTGAAVFQPVGTLSAGERLRLAFACQLGGPRRPGLLLADEPDNHLDLPSLRAVEHALAQFTGGLVLVSHDPAFLAAVGVEDRLALGG